MRAGGTKDHIDNSSAQSQANPGPGFVNRSCSRMVGGIYCAESAPPRRALLLAQGCLRLRRAPPTPPSRQLGPPRGRGKGRRGGAEEGGSGGRKEGVLQSCDLGGDLLVIGSKRGRKTKERCSFLHDFKQALREAVFQHFCCFSSSRCGAGSGTGSPTRLRSAAAVIIIGLCKTPSFPPASP